MKQIRIITCLSFLVANIGLQTALAKDTPAPTSPEQLRSQLEKAFKAKNTEAVLGFVNWRGVLAEMRTMQIMSLTYVATQGVTSVTLVPLPADYQITNQLNGVRYYPNIKVMGLVSVQTPKNGTTTFPYGTSGGAYYIGGVITQTFDATERKATSLGISVIGTFPDQKPGVLNCSYVYVTGGKEISGSLKLTNILGTGFWGDYVKSCKVTKISGGSGTLQVVINQGKKIVFDSGMLQSEQPVVYERK